MSLDPFNSLTIAKEHYERIKTNVSIGRKLVPPDIKKLEEHYYIPPGYSPDMSIADAKKLVAGICLKSERVPEPVAISHTDVDPTGSYQDDEINFASVFFKMDCESNAVMRSIYEKVRVAFSTETETNIKNFCALITKVGQSFTSDFRLFGDAHPITEKQYYKWVTNKDIKVRVVGPYLLTKILHQSKLAFTLLTSKADGVYGDPFLAFTHNGHRLVCQTKYDLQADTIANPETTMSSFLDGIKYRKRALQFRPTTSDAYDAVEMFMFRYDVVNDAKKKLLVAKMSEHAPWYDEPVVALLKRFLEHLVLPVKLINVDEVWDYLAGCADRIFSPADYAVFREARVAACSVAQSTIRNLSNAIDAATDLNDRDKFQYLAKLGFSTEPKRTMEYLDQCRHKRNRKGVKDMTQMIQKNVASAFGPNSVQFVDTSCKAQNMIQYHYGQGGTFKGRDVTIIGVAYNHMAPVLERYRGDVKSLTYCDIVSAKDSLETFREIDVLDWKPRTSDPFNEVIIDDSWLHEVNNKTLAKKGLDPKLLDFTKVKRFCDNPHGTVFIKVSLRSLSENNNIRDLFLPRIPLVNGAKGPVPRPPYKYVRVMKFGKLHNDEVYIYATNDPGAAEYPRRNDKFWNTDVAEICQCIYMANKCIQAYNDEGVRFNPESGAGFFWHRAMFLMMSSMYWYKAVVFNKIDPLVGGVDLKSVSIDASDGYYFSDLKIEDEYEGGISQDKKGVNAKQFVLLVDPVPADNVGPVPAIFSPIVDVDDQYD